MEELLQQKIKNVIRIVAACLIIQLLITYRLWVPGWRTVPLVPLFHFFPFSAGNTVDLFMLSLLVICCAWLLFSPAKKIIYLLIPLLFFVLVLEDVSRLQPWVYLYSLMFLYLFFQNKQGKHRQVLFAWKLILSSVYVWSGVQKLNPHFATEMFPWLTDFTGASGYFYTHTWWAYSVACLEVLAGIALWIPKLRKPACLIIFGMHLFILLSLGPLGHNWNFVVWPWNIAFAWIVFELFYKKDQIESSVVLKSFYVYSLLFIMGLLPVFNFFGKADHFLSAGYYSSLASMAAFYFPATEKNKLPLSAEKSMYLDEKTNEGILMLDNWAIEELNVPLYPEDRTHISLAKKICPCMENQSGSGLRLLVKTRYGSETKEVIISCDSLMGKDSRLLRAMLK